MVHQAGGNAGLPGDATDSGLGIALLGKAGHSGVDDGFSGCLAYLFVLFASSRHILFID
jgi:hypothetical protein